MTLNANKCRSINTFVHKKRLITSTKPVFNIDGVHVPVVSDGSFLTYLGHQVGTSGVLKPTINNLSVWLERISRAPLKPDQKVALIRDFVIPKLLYGLQTPSITGGILRDADRLIRMKVRQILHLNAHTADCFIHASIRDGGLGIARLRLQIPHTMLKRIRSLLDTSSDEPVLNVINSEYGQKLQSRLQTLSGQTPPSHIAKTEISNHTTTSGLEACNEDSSSRQWIINKPNGWSGRDYVKAVQLRSNNLPTAAIPSNPEHLRQCRGQTCNVPETIAHILQKCPVVHHERIARHNEIACKVARYCRVKKKKVVEEEPHIRHTDGQLYKPDLAIHIDNNKIVIADVQVTWETSGSLPITYQRKKDVYDNLKFREAAAKRWPNMELLFTPILIGARGVWPRCNSHAVELLQLDDGIKRSCVHSALKWGPSIHGSFMRAVWKRRHQ